jgi:hypothetical protein
MNFIMEIINSDRACCEHNMFEDHADYWWYQLTGMAKIMYVVKT